jgi:hypothetical protein
VYSVPHYNRQGMIYNVLADVEFNTQESKLPRILNQTLHLTKLTNAKTINFDGCIHSIINGHDCVIFSIQFLINFKKLTMFCLFCNTFLQRTTILCELKERAKEIGLNINVEKTKAMMQNRKRRRRESLTVTDHDTEVVRRFNLLKSSGNFTYHQV